MPRKARPNPKPERQRIYIREWRKYAPKFAGTKGLTLAKLSERLMLEHSIDISEGQLSRIERGEQGYFQDLMEAIADICGTSVPSLIMRDPSDPERAFSMPGSVDPKAAEQDLTDAERELAEAYIAGLKAARSAA